MSARRGPAKLGTFAMMRAWAIATGLVLIGWFFGALLVGRRPEDIVAPLIAAIGGFEFALYANDLWRRRGMHHG